MKKFRFQNQRAMLTYKTHIEKTKLINFINEICETTFCRCAHESSDQEHSYEHTHCVVEFNKNFQTTNERKFDYDGIHPHIKIIKTRSHMCNAKKYIAKQDPENADLLETSWVDSVWQCDTVQDALQKCDGPSEVLGTISAFNLKPKEDYKRPPPEKWYDWQEKLINYLKGPVDDRKILWIYDPVGGHGKSVVARYITEYMHGIMLTQFGGARDSAHILSQEPTLMDRPIIIDLPRKAESKDLYSPLEMIKNGYMTSTKYNGGTLSWRPGHVVVMANFMPDKTGWSHDRYKKWTLRDPEGSLNIKKAPLSGEKRTIDQL